MRIYQKIIKFGYGAAVLLAVAMFALPQASASAAKEIELNVNDYGYGEYIITARGVGYDGVYDEDQVVFYYLPTYGEVVEDEKTGKYYLNVDYQADNGTEETRGDVAKIIVNIYDVDGKLVEAMSPIEILPPNTRVELPFAAKNMPSGDYTISISSYDRDGNLLFRPFEIKFRYEEIAVPDTGRLLESLNISRADYLATGMIIFFLVVVAGMFTILRRSRATVAAKGTKTTRGTGAARAVKGARSARATMTSKTTKKTNRKR